MPAFRPDSGARDPGPVVRSGTSPEDAQVVVVGLHGRDQDPSYLIDHVVQHMPDDLGICWLLPAARDHSWYPDRADAASEANDAAVASAIGRLDALLAELGGRTVPVALLGFSQGACLACEFAARRPARVDALVALTGGLTGRDAVDFVVLPGQAMPAYFAVGDGDEWITPDRVHASAVTFERAGASVAVEITAGDAEHRIRTHEIDAVGRLLRQLAQGTS